MGIIGRTPSVSGSKPARWEIIKRASLFRPPAKLEVKALPASGDLGTIH
jgi:hypothetical protein